MKVQIKTGDRFNKLVVIKEVERFKQPSGQTQRGFLCWCDCGNMKKVRLSHLRHNRVISCGCVLPDRHGMSRKKIHNIWRGMRDRTRRPDHISHKYYYDKGISVCKEWEKFIPFYEWAKKNGYKDGLVIDRKDSNKGYNPDNCRFVTPRENSLNRKNILYVTYNGKKRPFVLVLEEKGLLHKKATISSRIKRGYSAQEAIDKPIRKGNYKGFQRGRSCQK